MTRDEWVVLPIAGNSQLIRVRRDDIGDYWPKQFPEGEGTQVARRHTDDTYTVKLSLAEFEALLFGSAPSASDDYTRAAEQERDKAREQRDDYKRQLLELQRKCEAMTGASTYGNAAVMWAEADVKVSMHFNDMPPDGAEFDQWQDERVEMRAKVDNARAAFLRLYRERHDEG